MTPPLGDDRRLEQLYEISKLFTAFGAVEYTMDAALQIITGKLPLRSAILIEAVIGGHTDMVVWACVGNDPIQLDRAKAHASEAFAYLIGARETGAIDVRDDVRENVGMTQLPVPTLVRRPPEPTRQFIVIPLVVGHGIVFGALQLEGAQALDRGDLVFTNAIANQLAIAISRDRAWNHDVVRRREAERLQLKYERLVDHLDAAFVWEADAGTHRITYVSAPFERLFGVPRERCLEDPDWWNAHLPREDRELLERTFTRALDEQTSQHCEHRCTVADGTTRWLRTNVHFIDADGEPLHFQCVSFDITAARLTASRSAPLLDAVAAREQTLAIVAHEMRTPLTTIMVAVSLLSGHGTIRVGPSSRAIATGTIERAAAQLERLITDLLDFASIDAGRLSIAPEICQAAALVHDSIARFAAAAELRHVALSSQIEADLPALWCDRDRILQVLANLIGNAIKIIPEGARVRLSVHRDGDEVVFAVADTGPGIAAADQQRLFERYWRSPDAAYQGTGLGLAIARQLVDSHHGRIWVESALGHGATFSFTLPLAAA